MRLTFAEAAAHCGFKSRSTLYRLRDQGALDRYMHPGSGGRQLLETDPVGLPSLRERVLGCIQWRGDVVARHGRTVREARAKRLAREGWGQVAAALNADLEAIEFPPLTGEAAAVIAAGLVPALRAGFGEGGPRWLREQLAKG